MGKRVRSLLVVAVAVTFAVGFTACGGGGGGGKKKKKAKVTSVTPGNGPLSGGTTITIVTEDFKDDFTVDGVPAVRVGGVNATGEAATGPATLTAVTPAGAAPGAVDVEVASVGGQTARLVGGFTYDTPPTGCQITTVSPAAGPDSGGNTVVLFGSNFELPPATTTVTFGTVPATNVVVVNTTQISCTAPAFPGGGVVDVVVTSTNTSCTSAGGYTYIVNPTCTVSSVVPGNGPIAGGTNVSISGTGFELGSSVTFGGDPATNIVFVTPTLITCDTPADPLGQPLGGYSVDVVVDTPSGAQCSRPNGFTYNPATVDCTITNVAPTNGPQGGGTVVTIDGTNFKPVGVDPTVTFGGVAGAVNPASTDTQITVTTPPAAAPATVDIVILNSTGGMCSLLGAYTYDPPVGTPCTINSISPNTGDVSGGTAVTILGADFDPVATGVFFDGISATNIFVNGAGDTITCNTPAGTTLGAVDVDVVPQSGQPCVEPGGFTYTGCTFTINPNIGRVDGGNTVVLSGVGFEPGVADVFFGTEVATSYISRTATSITCVVPASATGQGPVDVTVVNPGFGTQCVLTNGYTYSGCEVTDLQPSNGDKIGLYTATLTGTDFDPAGANVFFGTNLAGNVSVNGAGTQITCDVPPSLVDGPVDVRVVNLNGNSCDSPIQFTYNTPASPVPCTLSAVNPSSGPVDGGTPVTITGSNFDVSGASVLFGNQAAESIVVVSAGQIDCVSPQALAPGAVNVSVVNANGGTCTLGGAFDYIPPVTCNPCTATSMSPDPVTNPLQAGGESLPRQLFGTEFCSAATVQFLQIDPVQGPLFNLGNITAQTATQLDVVVPAAPVGPGMAFIFVENGTAGICGPLNAEYQ